MNSAYNIKSSIYLVINKFIYTIPYTEFNIFIQIYTKV